MKGYLKWQDIVKYVGGSAVSLTTVVFLILNLAGMEYSIPEDTICGPECFSPIQVNSTYWEICAEHAGDRDIIFKKTVYGRRLWLNLDKVDNVVTTNSSEIEVGLYVPTIKKYSTVNHDEYGYLRPIKDGDCFIKRQTKSRPQGSTFYIFGNKTDAFDTVKWSFNMDSVYSNEIDIDPKWVSVGSYEHVSIAGREYTPNCLTDCHLLVNVTFKNGDLNLKKNELTKTIKESKGKDFNILSSGVDYLVNQSYIESVIDYKDCVTSIKCNSSNCEDRTCDYVIKDICYYNTRCQDGFHHELKWKYVWRPVTNDFKIKKDKYVILDFWVKKKASLGESRIDIVPKIKDYSLTKMAWWSSDWDYKRPNTVVSNGTLTNFPYLLNGTGYLDTATLISDGKMDASCNSIRMVNGSEDSELSFEIANNTVTTYGCNQPKTEIWVRNNVSSGSNTQDYVYYNDTSASSGEDKTGVWDSNYLGVWHLAEGEVPRISLDSTSNNADLDVLTSDQANWDTCVFGKCIDLDGDDAIATGNGEVPIGANDETIEVWINTTNTGRLHFVDNQGTHRIMSHNTIGVGKIGCEFTGSSTALILSQSTINDGNWHYIVCVSNQTHADIYFDGVIENSSSHSAYTSNLADRPFRIGGEGYSTGNYFPIAQIDEVRYSNVARSAEYINQTYYQYSSTKFSTLGAEETEALPSNPANITVDLKSPADNNLNDSLTVEFGYTPLSYGDAIYNCSLYTNISSREDNTSAIVNNTVNTITETFPSNGNYSWNVKCYNSTHGVFASANRTINIFVSDSTPPLWNDTAGYLGSNSSEIEVGDGILLYGMGYDAIGLDWAWLSTNESGSWENKTTINKIEDDTEDASDGRLDGHGWGQLTNMSDENWDTYEKCIDNFNAWYDENYTLPSSSIISINITFKVDNPKDHDYTYIWNYDKSDWDLKNTTNADLYETVTISNIYTMNSSYIKSNEPFIWRYLTDGGVGVTKFYESMVVFEYEGINDMNDTAATWTWSNFTWSNSSLTANTTVAWKIYYNDTDGNENVTDVNTFTVYSEDFNLTYPSDTTEVYLNVSSCVGLGCYQTGYYTPENQSTSTPFYTLGNNGTVNIKLNATLNETLNSCLDIFLSINSTYEPSIDYNITYASNTTIATLNPKEEEELWEFIVLDNCTAGSTYNFDLNFTVG